MENDEITCNILEMAVWTVIGENRIYAKSCTFSELILREIRCSILSYQLSRQIFGLQEISTAVRLLNKMNNGEQCIDVPFHCNV